MALFIEILSNGLETGERWHTFSGERRSPRAECPEPKRSHRRWRRSLGTRRLASRSRDSYHVRTIGTSTVAAQRIALKLRRRSPPPFDAPDISSPRAHPTNLGAPSATTPR